MNHDAATGKLISSSLRIEGLYVSVFPYIDPHSKPVCWCYQFCPYYSSQIKQNDADPPFSNDAELEEALKQSTATATDLKLCLDVALENMTRLKANVLVLGDLPGLTCGVLHALHSCTNSVQFNITAAMVGENTINSENSPPRFDIIHVDVNNGTLGASLKDTDICILLSDKLDELATVLKHLSTASFVLTASHQQQPQKVHSVLKKRKMINIVQQQGPILEFQLWRTMSCKKDIFPVYINEHSEFLWVDDLKQQLQLALKSNGTNVWIICDQDCNSGIVGMVKCLLFDSVGKQIR